MQIYMAGGVSGNLSAYFKMQVYLVGTYSREYVIKEVMKLYLAGNLKHCQSYFDGEVQNSLFILESFLYAKKAEWIMKLAPDFKGFMLDSGAFTFMSGNGEKQNWDQYVDEYASFIKKYNVELFLELDIDVVVGLTEVERLRTRLEESVGRQCIPVWHRSRGKDYWLKLIKDYKYVAIGGIVSGEIRKEDFSVFNYFLKTAQKENCKVHGLGFTSFEDMKRYRFYSVDSTAWLYGNRGGSYTSSIMER